MGDGRQLEIRIHVGLESGMCDDQDEVKPAKGLGGYQWLVLQEERDSGLEKFLGFGRTGAACVRMTLRLNGWVQVWAEA